MGAGSDTLIRWHYTTGDKFAQIVESGEIRPAKRGVPKGERPAVWFSINQEWEPTANKLSLKPDGTLVSLTKHQTFELANGLARIGVASETAPHDWAEFKQLSRVRSDMARSLYQAALQQGSKPSWWFVSFDSVPRSKWIAVEIWGGSRWERVTHEPVASQQGAE